MSILTHETFMYRGRAFSYWDHPYNTTRLNERAVEIPLGLWVVWAKDATRALEIGAVLPHYLPKWNEWATVSHLVIDLYEDFPGVTTADVLTWEPSRHYDRILSISTLEHLGGPDQCRQAVERLKRWLEPDGTLWITLPHGQPIAPWVEASFVRSLGMTRVDRLDKVDPIHHLWAEAALDAPPLAYDGPSPWANTLYLLEYRRGD